MWLILENEEAKLRNCYEALKRKCDMVTTKAAWNYIEGKTHTALDVDEGDGLTEEELGACVDELPKGFAPTLDAND